WPRPVHALDNPRGPNLLRDHRRGGGGGGGGGAFRPPGSPPPARREGRPPPPPPKPPFKKLGPLKMGRPTLPPSLENPCCRRWTGPSNIFDDLNISYRPSPAKASVRPSIAARSGGGIGWNPRTIFRFWSRTFSESMPETRVEIGKEST